MLDIIVRRLLHHLHPFKVGGSPGGRSMLWTVNARKRRGAISINGVTEMHFGACKWRINPPSTEEVPLKKEAALHIAYSCVSSSSCLPSNFPLYVSCSRVGGP